MTPQHHSDRERPGLLAGLERDDARGIDVVRPVGLSVGRLHRDRHGNVTLLVLIMGLVFYALTAMVWNTGQVTSAKIEAQTAADTAAYSSAVWSARAINLTTGSNMAIQRHTSAVIAANPIVGLMMGLGPWYDWYKATKPFCNAAVFAVDFGVSCGIAWAFIFALEVLPRWLPFMLQYTPGAVLANIKSWPKIFELFQFQQDLVRMVPKAVDDQRKALEEYYDCDINLVRGDGSTSIRPPLKRGYFFNSALPFLARSYKELLSNEPDKPKKGKKAKPGSWNHEPELKYMFVGKGADWWTLGITIAGAITIPIVSNFHHVLTTQYGPLEFSPALLPRGWETYTVMAAARKREENRFSEQPPRFPLGFMAPGLFDKPLRPVAYAQAETFNGIDGQLLPPWMLLGSLIPYPWRVWTPWGWSWEARLSHGDPLSIYSFAKGSMVPSVAGTLFTSAPHNLQVSTAGLSKQLTTH